MIYAYVCPASRCRGQYAVVGNYDAELRGPCVLCHEDTFRREQVNKRAKVAVKTEHRFKVGDSVIVWPGNGKFPVSTTIEEVIKNIDEGYTVQPTVMGIRYWNGDCMTPGPIPNG